MTLTIEQEQELGWMVPALRDPSAAIPRRRGELQSLAEAMRRRFEGAKILGAFGGFLSIALSPLAGPFSFVGLVGSGSTYLWSLLQERQYTDGFFPFPFTRRDLTEQVQRLGASLAQRGDMPPAEDEVREVEDFASYLDTLRAHEYRMLTYADSGLIELLWGITPQRRITAYVACINYSLINGELPTLDYLRQTIEARSPHSTLQVGASIAHPQLAGRGDRHLPSYDYPALEPQPEPEPETVAYEEIPGSFQSYQRGDRPSLQLSSFDAGASAASASAPAESADWDAQQWTLWNDLMAACPDLRYALRANVVVVSGPQQTGKSSLAGAIAYARHYLFGWEAIATTPHQDGKTVFGGIRVIGANHRFEAIQDFYDEMVDNFSLGAKMRSLVVDELTQYVGEWQKLGQALTRTSISEAKKHGWRPILINHAATLSSGFAGLTGVRDLLDNSAVQFVRYYGYSPDGEQGLTQQVSLTIPGVCVNRSIMLPEWFYLEELRRRFPIATPAPTPAPTGSQGQLAAAIQRVCQRVRLAREFLQWVGQHGESLAAPDGSFAVDELRDRWQGIPHPTAFRFFLQQMQAEGVGVLQGDRWGLVAGTRQPMRDRTQLSKPARAILEKYEQKGLYGQPIDATWANNYALYTAEFKALNLTARDRRNLLQELAANGFGHFDGQRWKMGSNAPTDHEWRR